MSTENTSAPGAESTTLPTTSPYSEIPKPTPLGVIANAVRGGLIGLAETIPGVSGGTLALITGIYGRLIESAKRITDLPRATSKGTFKEDLRRIDWWLLIPVAIGMVAVVFSMAGIMENFVTNQPVASRALFMGMITASITMPLNELQPGALRQPGMRGKAIAVFLFFSIALFALTSLPQAAPTQPPLWLVLIAASIAVCALVLPGVSGSFFLLVIGLYAPTMGAIHDRDFAYIGTFFVGALIGIVLFIRLLEWLLSTHQALTLVAMSGLMLGSLRALWPWQTENNELQGIGSDWGLALGLFILGAAIVSVVAYAQRRFSNSGSMD
ncbi:MULTISPECIES: DUF368 domain-containing protein [Corynebacterium]|uniref:DUF368 domain-containing protein n=1 Tax=Corynebacterium TaxID=1716 RepID=UPI0008A4DD87|nr:MULTISPECIES: DUF368 domain-containing protein [Corynebacterium]MDK7199098.1 DUF368 domain-containing protein [Corynebacterium amycolatum]OFM48913.1 DUF368 domain-containing protein [Corynebacterium sp. HMSC064H12]OFQ03487.1 DUF368 domain-containing protein [Corynebacterium sp. HMSC070B05]